MLGTTVALVAEDGATTPVFEARRPRTPCCRRCVSPSGRYAAILVAPDIVDNRYDTYQLPLPQELRDAHRRARRHAEAEREVVTMAGFDISWCQVPPG